MREIARADVDCHHGARDELDGAGVAGRGPRSRLAGEVDGGSVLHRDGIEAVANWREGAEHLEIRSARVGGARVARHVVGYGHRLRQVYCTRDVVCRVVRGRDLFNIGHEHAIAFDLDRAVVGGSPTAIPYLACGDCRGERVAVQGERTADVRGARHVDEGVRSKHDRAVRAVVRPCRRARVLERAAVHVHSVSREVINAFVVQRAAGINGDGCASGAEHGSSVLRIVRLILRALAVVGNKKKTLVDSGAARLLVVAKTRVAVGVVRHVRSLAVLDDFDRTRKPENIVIAPPSGVAELDTFRHVDVELAAAAGGGIVSHVDAPVGGARRLDVQLVPFHVQRCTGSDETAENLPHAAPVAVRAEVHRAADGKRLPDDALSLWTVERGRAGDADGRCGRIRNRARDHVAARVEALPVRRIGDHVAVAPANPTRRRRRVGQRNAASEYTRTRHGAKRRCVVVKRIFRLHVYLLFWGNERLLYLFFLISQFRISRIGQVPVFLRR